MYAEERQQAMARLVSRSRPAVGRRARRAVRRHHRDRPPRPLRARAARSRPPGPRRRGARRGPRRSSRPGSASATRPTPRPRTRIASAALSQLPPAGSIVLIDAGTTTARLAAALPRDRRLTVVTHAVPVAARLPACPRSSCTCCRAGSAPTTQAAVGAETVAALRRSARRHRLPRHQRHHPGSRPVHPRPRRGRHQARARRLRPRVVVLADSSKVGARDARSASPTLDRRRRPRHRRRHRPRGPRRRPWIKVLASKSVIDMIVTLTPNPSIDRTVALGGPLQRGAVHRRRSR